ncbi:MAG: hypothetical protein J6P07_00020 [Spirochaetaceae bacterium]|nr:hypothetical protein [Spirochaetaceae bacterium]MBO7419631.1 hypothetical protein [Spirochaetaceae bacterium]MBP5792666.1 hypothetical protein [Spirochaetaceae bacterium]
MLVISMADFKAEPVKYTDKPFTIEDSGYKWIVRPVHENFFTRLFSKKDDTIDGVHKPSRQLKAALRESKRMEKHPEKYKTYDNIQELFDELGIKI